MDKTRYYPTFIRGDGGCVTQLKCPNYFWSGLSERNIGNCRNVRGLGMCMVVFRLFEKLRHSNERATKFESLYQE